MKSSPKKKNRFMAFLSSLCSAKANADQDQSKDKKKCKLKVQKIPRLTFQLDRVLVKLSRKNVAEEQFMQNEVLTYHLEKYLVGRFKECYIVVFSGQFSNFLIEKIPFSIELKSTKQEAYESQNNYILSNQEGPIKLRSEVIDALVFQFYFGQKQNSCKKSQHSEKTQETNDNTELNEEIDKIQRILKFYQKKVSSFVFICHKNLRLEHIHGLFLVFREKYMFELQKVRKIQKTVCNIIYVSSKTKFLRIDDMSLCDFIITEFDKIKGFGEEKERNNTQTKVKLDDLKSKNEQSKNRDLKKIQTNKKIEEQSFSLKQFSKRQSFQCLILKLFEKNLHLQVSQAFSTIFQFPQKKPNKINWFLDMMHERYPESQQIIEKYRAQPYEEKEEFTKTCSEFTPIFAQKSNNFSKMTALFRTHSSGDEDDFILCKEQQNNEMEF